MINWGLGKWEKIRDCGVQTLNVDEAAKCTQLSDTLKSEYKGSGTSDRMLAPMDVTLGWLALSKCLIFAISFLYGLLLQ